jgi:ribulose-bisphosphate carboxylase small chain
MDEIGSCRNTFPNHYVKVNAFDAAHGVESLRLSFIVNRPKNEPGFALLREEAAARRVRYTTRAYAADKPEGSRY